MNDLPATPGCYIFKDENGEVLYVGKAINLRARVRQYFNTSIKVETVIGFPFLNAQNEKTQKLAMMTQNIEYMKTESEADALLLEYRLIKQLKPLVNTQMNRERPVFYICFKNGKERPGLYLSEESLSGNNCVKLYGTMWTAEETLQTIGDVWQLPVCKTRFFDNNTTRTCLRHSLNQCLSPCRADADFGLYNHRLQDAIAFLSGKKNTASAQLKKKLSEAVEKLDFEQAALLRDQIESLCRIRSHLSIPSRWVNKKRIYAFLKGFHESSFILFYIENGQILITSRFGSLSAWEDGRDRLLQRVAAHDFDSPLEYNTLTYEGIFKIQARKSFVDASKTLNTDKLMTDKLIADKLNKAVKKLQAKE